ncbi:MAG: phasin [Rhodobacteraceae bacterium]|nr:phasin [Paracoccaceae bacterium]
MTKPNGFEIPDQMRDFAERSVDQAKKAFDDFMSVTQQAVENMEDSASVVRTGTSEVNEKTLSFAEEHMQAAFQFAQQIVKARDLEEMVSLQQTYLKNQMETLGEQARDLSDHANKAAQNVAKAAKKT